MTCIGGSVTGFVTFTQRFGAALSLNIHLHTVVPDGEWRFVNGQARFLHVPAPIDADIKRLLARLIRQITQATGSMEHHSMKAVQESQEVFALQDDA